MLHSWRASQPALVTTSMADNCFRGSIVLCSSHNELEVLLYAVEAAAPCWSADFNGQGRVSTLSVSVRVKPAVKYLHASGEDVSCLTLGTVLHRRDLHRWWSVPTYRR